MTRDFVVYYPRAMVGNGGPTVAVWSWVRAMKSAGHRVSVLYDSALEGSQPLRVPDVPVVPLRHRLAGRYRFPIEMDPHVKPGSVLIVHSAFSLGNVMACRAAARMGAHYVLTPHGAYADVAMRRRSLLKRLWIAFESRLIRGAAAVHAFVESEVPDFRKRLPKVPVIIAPTPIQVDPVAASAPRAKPSKYFAWLGRYDIQIKGIDILIDAYRQIPADVRVPLRLHGRDARNVREDVQALVDSADLGDTVTVGGPLDGEEKKAFLQGASLFVMPSRTESFSIALVEALSLNVPCLISTSMPIADELNRAGVALTATPDPTAFAKSLIDVIQDASLLDRLEPAAYVRSNFSDEAVSASFGTQLEAALRLKDVR